MSSQAERIKAFKLAQHARLQKQDEEEPWISSEELCTEGSSDEETHINVKSSHRKPKRNAKTEKRGISPLAQPPRITDIESTSTYQRDSKYLLPENINSPGANQPETSHGFRTEMLSGDTKMGNIDTRVQKLNLNTNKSEAHLPSKVSESSTDSDDSDLEEVDEVILWRPKRGSIKLPEFPEGMEERRTLQHDIFEMESLYNEIAMNMNCMKRTRVLKRSACTTVLYCEDNNGKINLNKFNDSSLDKLVESISSLDLEITKTDHSLENVVKERKEAQEEMCKLICGDSEESSPLNKNSQTFLQLCDFENSNKETECNNTAEEEIVRKSSDLQSKSAKKIRKSNKKFILRNIELAKQYSMAQFCLTDEEKLKLDSLLADIDSEEYSMDSSKKEHTEGAEKSFETHESKKNDECMDEECDDAKVNYFRLKEEEMFTIQDLESKLNELLTSYEEDGRKAQEPSPNIEDELDSADKSGKFWKHYDLQKRLEHIDRELDTIVGKNAMEQKKLEGENQKNSEEGFETADESNKSEQSE